MTKTTTIDNEHRHRLLRFKHCLPATGSCDVTCSCEISCKLRTEGVL